MPPYFLASADNTGDGGGQCYQNFRKPDVNLQLISGEYYVIICVINRPSAACRYARTPASHQPHGRSAIVNQVERPQPEPQPEPKPGGPEPAGRHSRMSRVLRGSAHAYPVSGNPSLPGAKRRGNPVGIATILAATRLPPPHQVRGRNDIGLTQLEAITLVIPAKAGIQRPKSLILFQIGSLETLWIPAFAGMTGL